MLLTLLFFAVFIYLLFSILLLVGIKKLKSGTSEKRLSISVVVAVKNEEQYLESCLDALSNQNYPEQLLEIIIVDDQSTDNTPQILEDFKNKCSLLKIIKNEISPEGMSSKKIALKKAVDLAIGDILVFTDGDCKPTQNWLKTIVSYFDADVGFVAGFSPLVDPEDSLFGKIIELDSLATVVVASGSIGMGSAVTCSGRNMAYRREIFNSVNGFDEILHSVSGDDDLFLQLIKKMTDWKIKFAINIDSIVLSFQNKTIKSFFKQKRRHLSAGKYYNKKLQIYYALFHLSNLFIFLFFIFSLFLNQNIIVASSVFVCKIAVDWILLKEAANIFNQKKILKYLLFWELFFVLYHAVIGPCSWTGKIKWK